ncbi:hypothetical protein [Streptomyces chrestomyceticus]|uniref:hypothetical protein n=1 Tax=Streptomyces chrestomyceticus TaxID=68185 RepID=UPI0037B4B2AB
MSRRAGSEGPDGTASASASRTGKAKADTGGTAVSGTVVGSTISSTTIGHQSNNWYSLFSRREKTAAGWGLYLIIALISVVVLVMQPEGPWEQFVLPYALLVVAHCACLLLAIDAWAWRGEGRWSWVWLNRFSAFRGPVRLVVSFLCLTLTVLALLRMAYLKDHGELDITNSVDVSGNQRLKDKGSALLTAHPEAPRRYLRLTVTVESSKPYTSCKSDTTLDLWLDGPQAGGQRESLRGGYPVKLALGEKRTEIKVRLMVHTTPGCEVDVQVEKAALHD